MGRSYVPSRSAEDWSAHLRSPEKQWRAGKSAFELAHVWQGADHLPTAVAGVLARGPGPLRSLKPLIVLAEHQTPLPGEGPASHSDALCLARGSHGLVVVVVEGKESEGFDVPVREWLAAGGANRRTRLKGVCRRLSLDPDGVLGIHWQLLHRTAAAVIEAENYGASSAVMLVHSFSPAQHGLDAYASFVQLFGEAGRPNEVTELRRNGNTALCAAWVADQALAAADSGTAEDIFLAALDWLRDNYRQQGIFDERDIERALQTRMAALIRTRRLPLRVFHGYPIQRGLRRALAVDLVILDDDNTIQLAIELKYEPAVSREGSDIWAGKFPVTTWGEIEKDVARLRSWVDDGRAEVGYAVLVDEGGRYRRRADVAGWEPWEKRHTGYETSILLRRVPPKPE